MTTVHVVVGVGVILLNGVAGVTGAAAWLRDRPSIRFWPILRVAQVAVVVQAMLGAYLLLSGHEADGLHYLYGVLPLAVSLLAEAARAGAAQQEIGERDFDAMPPDKQHALALAILRRETGIMAVSSLVILFLALRAAGTSAFSWL